MKVGAILLPRYMLGDRKCMKKLYEEPVRDLPNTVKIKIKKGKTVTAQHRHLGGTEV